MAFDRRAGGEVLQLEELANTWMSQ